MLKADALTFGYGSAIAPVLQDFTLELPAGSITGLTGKSGCGKTTLGRILSGYLSPLKGKVLLHETALPASGYCPVQLVSQHPETAVNGRWKIRKILSEPFGTVPEQKILDSLQLSRNFLERNPHELSGGELQRVCLCRILNPATEYIIADEMTGMLDAITQANIWNTMLDFAKLNGTGILVISHDRALLNRLCDCVVEMKTH